MPDRSGAKGLLPLGAVLAGFITGLVWLKLSATSDVTDTGHKTDMTSLAGHQRRAASRRVLPLRSHDDQPTVGVRGVLPTQWRPPTLPDHLQGADQADPDLIREIRDKWILAPDHEPLNLSRPHVTYFAQSSQDRVLDTYFHNKTDGFYVECGAYDGEAISNTLYFERERGWGGLLIEPNPASFDKIVHKHRHAYMLNACLSPGTKSETLTYTSVVSKPYLSRLESDFKRYQQWIQDHAGDLVTVETTMQCFPIYAILAALGQPHVDFFSLDVEGSEMAVLQSAYLDRMDVDLWVVETGEGKGKEEKVERFWDVMETAGYAAADIEGDAIDVAFTRL